ncbi:MAG: hypothetical protein C4278_01570 [Patescibacteria group bacterium]
MLIQSYDLRGIFEKDISPSLVKKAVERYLKFLNNPSKVLIAYDSNPRSFYIKNFILEEFKSFEELGLLPTPIFYYYVIKRKIPGIMITASHLPLKYVGMKFLLTDGSSWKPNLEIKEIKIEKFKRKKETVFKEELYDEYFSNLNKIVKNSRNKKIFVNFDLKNFFLKNSLPYFKKFKIIHSNKSKIKIKADLDNDRITIFYKNKKIINDLIFYYLAKEKKYKILGTPIYFSKYLERKLKETNKKIFYIETGHINFKNSYKKFKIDLAFEPSGHFYMFKDLKTEAPYLALILFLKKIPDFEKIENLKIRRFNVKIKKDFDFERLINFLKEKFNLNVEKFDGYFLSNKNIFIHLRKSATENVLRISLEGNKINYFQKEIKKWFNNKKS